MKKNLRALMATLIAMAILCTSALAASPITRKKEQTIKLDKGTTVKLEMTSYNYYGELVFNAPMMAQNDDGSYSVKTTEKSLSVIVVPENESPLFSAKVTSSHPNGRWLNTMLGGLDPISYSPDWNGQPCFIPDGQGYDPQLSKDKQTANFGSNNTGGGWWTIYGYYLPNPTQEFIDAQNIMNEEVMYLSGDLLVLTEDDIKTFTAINEVFGYSWPGLRELLGITAAPDGIKAEENSSSVTVNGRYQYFTAYTINGNNYFKLRDLAKVISGSDKQFEVTWDGAKNAINLVSGKAYTTVGGEMESSGVYGTQAAKASTSTIYKDGTAIKLTAYTINGNNYFKLRDLGEAFNFGVTWDGTKRSIAIDTTTGYTPD